MRWCLLGLVMIWAASPSFASEAGPGQQFKADVCNLQKLRARTDALEKQAKCFGRIEMSAFAGAQKIASSARFDELMMLTIEAGLKEASNGYASVFAAKPRNFPDRVALAAGIYQAWLKAIEANSVPAEIVDRYQAIYGSIFGCPYLIPSTGWCVTSD